MTTINDLHQGPARYYFLYGCFGWRLLLATLLFLLWGFVMGA